MQVQRTNLTFTKQSPNVTRKQLLDHTPTLAPTFEKYDGATAGELASNISKAPTSTPVTSALRIGGAAALAGGALATGMGVLQASLGLAGGGLAAVALGALSTWGGGALENELKNRNTERIKGVVEAANATAQTLVTVKDGKITDRNFFEAGAFTNPLEVREEGSGKVLAREVTVNGYVLKEDAIKGEVSLNETTRFAGFLELPTAANRVASLVHKTGNTDPEPLQNSRIEFNLQGQPRVGATGERYWDEEGFSYLNVAYVGSTYKNQLNEDGSAYLQGAGWFALQPPAGLLDLPVTGNSQRITPDSYRRLSFTYAASHGPLKGLELVPVTLSERPIGARIGDTTLELKDGQVEVRHGDQVRSFPGALDDQGVLTVQSEAGELRQSLNTGYVDLQLTRPGGEFRFSQSIDDGVFVYQIGDHSRDPVATVTPEGHYQVAWDGGDFTVEVPVPFAWL